MLEQPPARGTRRPLPVIEILPPSPTGAEPMAPSDERLTEFRPTGAELPRFAIWTLGCQMNRSDSEEMAGRLLAAGCVEAPAFEEADLIVINTCAIRELAERKVIGRQGQLARLKEANPSLRVVLTGCAVREMDRHRLARRFPAVDLFLRPDEEPELVDRLGLASAQGAIGLAGSTGTAAPDGAAGSAGTATPADRDGSAGALRSAGALGSAGATTLLGTTVVGAADHLAERRAGAVAVGAVARSSTISAWLPIIYGCDKTCTYCIVPFSRGPERSRPFDDIIAEARVLADEGFREVTLLGQNVNSYGHDLPAEERFGHVSTERWSGRRLDLRARPDLAELLRTIDGIRDPDDRPAIGRLRFVTSHPWDLSDRLIDAMAVCSSVCEHLHLPVQSGDDAVLRRMGRQYTIEHYLERLSRIREAVPGIAISTDVIVGFCGETEAQFEATLRLLETVRYDQVFAAAYSARPGTPATRLEDDVPADIKRRRLNELLALQEGVGLERNRAWLGREVEVLVDTIVRRRSHDHEASEVPGLAADGELGVSATGAGTRRPEGGRAGESGEAPDRAGTGHMPGAVALSGRTRHGKLVHLRGSPMLVGHLVTVRVDHAGPYALRGTPVA